MLKLRLGTSLRRIGLVSPVSALLESIVEIKWLNREAHYQGARRIENKELTNVNDCFQYKCNAENGLPGQPQGLLRILDIRALVPKEKKPALGAGSFFAQI